MTGRKVKGHPPQCFRIYCNFFVFFFFRDPYVIAIRSVSLPTHPPTDDYNRGEVLCAGFTILETKDNKSLVRHVFSYKHIHIFTYDLNKPDHYFSSFLQISYYNQASPEVLPYISTDIAGLSSSYYHIFCSCSQYLTRNRISPPL